MEQKKLKSKNIVLLDLLLFVIIGICIAMSVLLIINLFNSNKEYNDLKNNLNEVKEEVSEKEERIRILDKTIKEYENIDKTTTSVR